MIHSDSWILFSVFLFPFCAPIAQTKPKSLFAFLQPSRSDMMKRL